MKNTEIKQTTFRALLVKNVSLSIGLSVLLSLVIVFPPTYLFLKSTINNDIKHIENVSYESINTHLISSWSKQNTQQVYEDIQKEMPSATVFLQKTPAFATDEDRVFKPKTELQKELPELISRVEKSPEITIKTNIFSQTISAAIPIKAVSSCQACQSLKGQNKQATANAHLATILLQVPMSLDRISSTTTAIFFIFLFISSTILSIFLANRLVNTNLLIPLEELFNRIDGLRLNTQDRHIKWHRTPQKLIEVDQIDRKISGHIKNIQQIYDKLDALMVTEHETGLFHKTRFEEVIKYEVFRCKRYKHPFSLVLIKLAEAKVTPHKGSKQKIEPGAEYLFFGKLMQQITRETDLLFRLEEHIFAVVAPETDEEGSVAMRKALNERLEKYPIKDPDDLAGIKYEFKIRIGHASYSEEEPLSAKDIVKSAILSMKHSAEHTGKIET